MSRGRATGKGLEDGALGTKGEDQHRRVAAAAWVPRED